MGTSKPPIVVGDCSAQYVSWENITNKYGYDMVRNVASGLCINDNAIKCEAGNHVSGRSKCDGNNAKAAGRGNRFVWDASAKRLKLEECPVFCLGAAAAVDAEAELVDCANASFASWEIDGVSAIAVV